MNAAITSTSARRCTLLRPGRLPYEQAWAWQRELMAQRSTGTCGDMLLLLEHPPTITLGRASHPEHLLVSPEELARRGVALVESDRGGDVTYHGPGQLVGYPILKLSHHGGDVHRYLRSLEELLIRVLARYELAAGRREGLTGVWVGNDKIAAIGVRLSAGGITSHGFALNVTTDLAGFAQIVPCGIRGHGVTSLAALLGRPPALESVAAVLIDEFAALFGVEMHELDSP
jgi:lipoyl(octanoyl) transferase